MIKKFVFTTLLAFSAPVAISTLGLAQSNPPSTPTTPGVTAATPSITPAVPPATPLQ
ncbi:hypothetical protein [Coleofasciculus sp. H7-2]|uniref:hypothetical protein n=1 Tax=Coleofasciculus sp. H7-2 TaxID=3351545 RepID=UPI003672624B